jgi:trigger factor
MQVETISSWSKRITIEYPEEVVKQKVEEVFSEFEKKAKVPGFRKGKVPRDVIEMHFKKDIMEEVKESLLQSGFEEALKGAQIEVIANPLVESIEFDDSGFKAVLSVQIKPEIDVRDYSFLKSTVERVSVTDDDIENELKLLQKSMAVLKPIETARPVENGDYVLVDIKETVQDQKPVEHNNKLLKVGAGLIYEKIDKELPGMREGETKSINITFPEDIPDKTIAGKECNYQIVIKGIKTEVLPELNDAFAASVGNYKNLNELRAAISKRLEALKNIERDNKIKRQIIEQLVERNKIDIPPALVEEEMDIIVHDLVERGMRPEQFSNEVKESIYKEADLRARSKLIIENIAKKEGISASDEEVVSTLQKIAVAQRMKFEEVEHLLENPRVAEAIRFGIIEEKTMNYLKEKTRIEEKSSILWTPGSDKEMKK